LSPYPIRCRLFVNAPGNSRQNPYLAALVEEILGRLILLAVLAIGIFEGEAAWQALESGFLVRVPSIFTPATLW
jgi:hypothetical protein